MKKLIFKTILTVLFTVSFTGCDDYLDVNTPSDAVELDALNLSDIMGPIMLNTVYANYFAETVFGNYTQYFSDYGNQALGQTSASSAWSNIFTKVLPNIKVVKDKANQKGALHYEAVAKILEAINISFAVETWGDVPYSQSGKPFEFPNPILDDGQQVYNQALTLLNEAIITLEGNDSSLITLGTEDVIYGGDFDKWLRAAYTFKARMQLKMIKNGGTTAADVLTSIEKGFASNGDDFQLPHPDGKLNPNHSNMISRNTSNAHREPNDQLISMMNGVTYPFESGIISIDPRLPAIYAKLTGFNPDNPAPEAEPWRAPLNGGDGESSDGGTVNTYYKTGGFHTGEQSPLILVTYAEAMFIKAEAAFLANGGTTTSVGSTVEAYQAYMAGITANMAKIGVDGSDYMADAVVNVGEGGLMLNHIMKEKYIANIHNTETFNDMRRYNFSSEVFKGLALRLEEDSDSEFEGEWFRRAIYPLSEADANPNIEYSESSSITSIWLFQ